MQTWLPAHTAADNVQDYEMVSCPACTQMHFINRATGKLLGDKGV